MEDDLFKQRRKYDNSLKRYRERYQAMIVTQDNYKRSEDNRNLSRVQVESVLYILMEFSFIYSLYRHIKHYKIEKTSMTYQNKIMLLNSGILM